MKGKINQISNKIIYVHIFSIACISNIENFSWLEFREIEIQLKLLEKESSRIVIVGGFRMQTWFTSWNFARISFRRNHHKSALPGSAIMWLCCGERGTHVEMFIEFVWFRAHSRSLYAFICILIEKKWHSRDASKWIKIRISNALS